MDNTDLKNILSKQKLKPKPRKYELSVNMRDILNIMETEMADTKNKSWSKLNKSQKRDKLNIFIDSYELEGESIDERRNRLRELLITGLKQNKLNKQSNVKYNIETETIEKITILQTNENGDFILQKSKQNSKTTINKSTPKSNIDRIVNRSLKS